MQWKSKASDILGLNIKLIAYTNMNWVKRNISKYLCPYYSIIVLKANNKLYILR